MSLLYRLKNKLLLTAMALMLSSCSVISEELSCQFTEIDCYRFDYSSIDNFKDSVIEHSLEWSLQDPSAALSNLTASKDISIMSLKDSELLIESNPDDIFVVGQYISKNQKPREWLFTAEQAFLRSWISLSR